jgi:hemerythrin-like domain-containing protein
MLRDPNLIPLSRQHHHALALCVRLDRALQAGPIDARAWQEEIALHFAQEVSFHFAAEEAEIFPLAARFESLKPLVDELIAEHAVLRDLFARAASSSLADPALLAEFTSKLTAHIRKEERQLFEGMQGALSAVELDEMGVRLAPLLEQAGQACILPATFPKAK